jgi:hypothetical protein
MPKSDRWDLSCEGVGPRKDAIATHAQCLGWELIQAARKDGWASEKDRVEFTLFFRSTTKVQHLYCVGHRKASVSGLIFSA